MVGCAAVALLAACSGPAPDPVVACSEPRPQVCTREYLPVCAQRVDGTRASYATGCTACSDENVVGYAPGACE